MDDINRAFEATNPSEAQTERMLNNILNSTDSKRKVDFMKLLKPKMLVMAASMIIFVAVSVIVIKNITDIPSQKTVAEGEMVNTGDSSAGGSRAGESPVGDAFTEDSIAMLIDQFKIGNRTYILLSDEYKKEVNFPQTIKTQDIGEKISTIESSSDESLKGLDVYAYKPAGSQAVVAVKKENEYKLYKFLSFDSYNNNQDEDVAAYLDLFGIKSASDIAKIQFIGHSEQSKLDGKTDIKSEIVNKADIAKFYDFYSVIKNSSDKYFSKLFNYSGKVDGNTSSSITSDEMPPDYITRGTADEAISSSSKAGYAQDSVGVQSSEIAQAEPYYEPDVAISSSAQASSSTEQTKPSPTIDKGEVGSASGSSPMQTQPYPAIDQGKTGSVAGSSGAAQTDPSFATGQGEAGSSGGSAGTDALSNSVTIRIYNQSGVYFDAQYYPDFGFISRHEVSGEFAEFLASFIK